MKKLNITRTETEALYSTGEYDLQEILTSNMVVELNLTGFIVNYHSVKMIRHYSPNLNSLSISLHIPKPIEGLLKDDVPIDELLPNLKK